MDLLHCAKSSVRDKVPRLTAGAVALALAFAGPAFGTIVSLDPNQTDACIFTGDAGSCTVVQAQGGFPGANSNLNWLQLFGSGTSTYDESQGDYILSFLVTGGSGPTEYLPSGPIPDSWDFIVNSDSASPIYWSVFFQVGFSSGNYPSTTDTGVAAPGTEVTGFDLITFDGGGNVVYYNITIQLSSSSPFSVEVPDGSTLDLNPVPEPGSLGLIAAGATALMVRRKKRS